MVKIFLIFSQVEFVEPSAKTVRKPATNLVENVTLVVVAQGSCNLVIGHVGTISVLSPQGSECLGIVESKETLLSVLPVDHVVVLGLLQDSKCELP